MRFLFLSLLVFCAVSNPAKAEPSQTLIFGMLGAADTELLQKALTQKSGLAVQILKLDSNAAILAALASNKINFAWLAPFSAAKAVNEYGATPVLKAVVQGRANVYSAILSRASNKGITELDDLEDKNIAWGKRSSAATCVLPKASLVLRAKKHLEVLFDKQVHVDSDAERLHLLLTGVVDAAAFVAYDAKGTRGTWSSSKEKLRLLYITEGIPGYSLVVSQSLAEKNPKLVEKIVASLLSLADKKALDSLGISGFSRAKNKDFELIRSTLPILGSLSNE